MGPGIFPAIQDMCITSREHLVAVARECSKMVGLVMPCDLLRAPLWAFMAGHDCFCQLYGGLLKVGSRNPEN